MPYPRLDKRGANILQTRASDWAELFRDVRRGAGILIEGFERSEAGGNVRFTRARGLPEPKIYADKFVAIVRHPGASDRSVRVREVRYVGLPAQPCTGSGDSLVCQYEWADSPFDAWPMFGSTVMAYENDVLENGETVATPPSDTSVMRCFRNHDSWIVERTKVAEQGTAIIPAVVTSYGVVTVTVQPMKRDDAAAGGWGPDGPIIANMRLWGSQNGADFATFVSNPTAAIKDIIPVIVINGEKFAMQYVWMQTGFPNPDRPRGDCF